MKFDSLQSSSFVVKACRYKSLEDLASMFKHHPINCRDAYDNTPLHEAALWGREDVVQFLIDQGADIKATDKYGRTPLHWAEMRNHGKVAELLKQNIH